MTLRKLMILMWKHLMVRLRRFIHTPIEILSPVIFVVVLFCFKDNINPVRSGTRFDAQEIRNTDVFDRSNLGTPKHLVYTPDSVDASSLMDEVGRQLRLKRITEAQLRNKTRGFCGVNNLTEIVDWLDKMDNNDAIVLFDELNKEVWPEHLSYTVRMKGAFFTSEVYAEQGPSEPHKEFGKVYHPLLNLQWAIDTSFIQRLVGVNVTQDLYIQEFPSVSRVNVGAMGIICGLLQVLSWMSLFLVFVFLVARLVEERSTGIQELIKMVGVSSNLYGISHFLNVVPAGLMFSVVGTVVLKVSSSPLVPHTDGLLIFIMLVLYYVSVVAIAFPCSYISVDTQHTTSIAVTAYVFLWIPVMFVTKLNATGIALVGGLLPHVPIMWLWMEVEAREQYGEGLSMTDAFSSHSVHGGPVALGALFLVAQTLLMFALAWYLARVRPGKYGVALPWDFPLQKQYWTQNEVKPELSENEEEEPIAKEAKYFEEPPKDMETGIKIENVTKMFPKHTALTNVSLDVFKGEITVLLGHNGAGKTTLMSIITGMLGATEGRVLVNGMDITKAGDKVRTQMGLCPQHNLFFPDLTVLQHAMFFTLLKGGSFKDAREQSYDLLARLGIRDKAGVYSSALSGGMKRRLQLACALAGGASVLVLDEPTSGLDVETRRELWDLLLSLRGERTVLLTTHFMEEADALGDRVAALHLGRLRCYATPMYLKKAIGTGYRLTFTTNGLPRESSVSGVVASHVAGATLKQQTINSLSYSLPAAASREFPALFAALEERKSDLGIESIGVGASTLEEVFLKLCSDTDASFTDDEANKGRSEPTYNKVTGAALYWRQFTVLLLRQFRFVWYKKLSFFLLQVVLPITAICLFTAFTNNDQMQQFNENIALDVNLYSQYTERRVLCDVAGPAALPALRGAWPKVQFIQNNNLTEEVIRASEEDPTNYYKYIAGIELNDTYAKALFTTTVRHAAPVSVNLLSNALATRYLERADGRTFRTRFDPIQTRGPVRLDFKIQETKSLDLLITYSVVIIFVVFSAVINSASLPCKERESGARHIHLMSGCPAAVYWAATLVFHAAVCALFLLTSVAAAAATLDTDNTINSTSAILSMMLVLMMGCLAFLSLIYLVSCYLSESIASTVLVAILVVFGLVTTSMKKALEVFTTGPDHSFKGLFLSLCSYVMPPHTATMAFAKVAYSARLNAYCRLNRNMCPNLFAQPGLDVAKCCAGATPHCYMCMDENAPGAELITLTVQLFFYMTMVILAQHGVFNSINDRIFNIKYRSSSKKVVSDDDIVRAEAIYVDKQIELPKQKIEESGHVMLVSNLHKNYPSCRGRGCNAVKGISFSVKKGECFGLLGVNGAGKSTTFKMLTAEECPTLGNIYANGFYSHERGPYLRSLGYCPQFFGLDDFLTGSQNLELLLVLRGLDDKHIKQEVSSWIQVVGLEKYSSRRVVEYSGGCARRLAAAAALSTGAPLTLMDEPTAGVDVSARRRVWRALQRGLALQRSVIITSHSMDEMEALCARIAIMSGGVVRAVGTPSELRARHAAGHAVIIKVAPAPPPRAHHDVVDSTKSELERLKGTLHAKFNCTLKDEHKTMLHYHINETLRYSQLFSALEELRGAHPALVEDYAVTETTLEEVFLSFAKEHQHPEPQRRNHVV